MIDVCCNFQTRENLNVWVPYVYPQIKSILVITYTIRDLHVITSNRKYTPYRTMNIDYDVFMQRYGNRNYSVRSNLH